MLSARWTRWIWAAIKRKYTVERDTDFLDRRAWRGFWAISSGAWQTFSTRKRRALVSVPASSKILCALFSGSVPRDLCISSWWTSWTSCRYSKASCLTVLSCPLFCLSGEQVWKNRKSEVRDLLHADYSENQGHAVFSGSLKRFFRVFTWARAFSRSL